MSILPSGLPEHISDEESLARFLNSSRLFNASGLIKPAVFLPRNGETSVFRYEPNAGNEIWATAEQIIQEGRKTHGVAFIQALDVREIALDVHSKEPPRRHADIIGWQVGADVMSKAKQKELAALLAQGAELRRVP